ncbi:MAG TPA: hypothetical protein DGT23_24525 [Micromonosporaceae bacterium]|nr:hypothetical protein [Micromonosporaceae bacterium]
MDWDTLEAELTTALVDQVREMIADFPGLEFHAAALGQLYYETDGVITLPGLAFNTDGVLSELPGDWEFEAIDWPPDGRGREIERMLQDEACRSTVQHWHETFERFLAMLIRACGNAREQLDGFLVFIYDDDDPNYEFLLRSCLTESELAQHFPEIGQAEAERERVAALPPHEQVSFYVSVLDDFEHPLGSEEAQKALRDLGSAAIPALIPLITRKDDGFRAAKLLADIGIADDAAIDALSAALTKTRGPDQNWVAAALSRLGRLDLVLARVGDVPPEVVVAAVKAPYTAFRDHAVSPRPLDYEPLESFLSGYPEMALLLEKELAPGSSYCEITKPEVDEAIRGLSSPHALVRQHAVCVLGARRLGDAVGAHVIPRLARLESADPDPDVRRLAELSLSDWKITVTGSR